jgi:hypothetical protein
MAEKWTLYVSPIQTSAGDGWKQYSGMRTFTSRKDLYAFTARMNARVEGIAYEVLPPRDWRPRPGGHSLRHRIGRTGRGA